MYGPGPQQHPFKQQQYQSSTSKYQAPPFRQQQQFQQPTPTHPVQNNSGHSLEKLMKKMATNNIQFQQNVSATIQDLQTQIGQLATIVNQMQQQGFGNIPAQTIINPKGNVSIITLKKLQGASKFNRCWCQIDDGAKTDSSTFCFQIHSCKESGA